MKSTKGFRRGTLAAVSAIALVALAGPPAVAAETESAIARGGRLYDKWFAENKAAKPADDHPAYPHKGGKYGKDASWRCKECHVWDYKGKEGAYATGGHATGIKGIQGAAGKDGAAIVAILKDKNHGFADAMSPANSGSRFPNTGSRARSNRRTGIRGSRTADRAPLWAPARVSGIMPPLAPSGNALQHRAPQPAPGWRNW